jgi:hypothetical protein
MTKILYDFYFQNWLIVSDMLAVLVLLTVIIFKYFFKHIGFKISKAIKTLNLKSNIGILNLAILFCKNFRSTRHINGGIVNLKLFNLLNCRHDL